MKYSNLATSYCQDCKESPYDHQHHVRGRKVDPDAVVCLCGRCHARHHRGMILYRNAASQSFNEWFDDMIEHGIYIPWNDRLSKLDDLGYLPVFDGWEQSPGAQDTARYLYGLSGYARSLRQYLINHEVLYLYPGERGQQ